MRIGKVLGLVFGIMACGATRVDEASLSQPLPRESVWEERWTVHDPGKVGPFRVLSYQPQVAASGYKSAIVYYPEEDAGLALPATTLSGGYTNTKEQMSWLGQHLASHGIVTIVFTPTNNMAGNAQIWANGHKAALETLVKENGLARSPLLGRIHPHGMGVSGYSYGGAGAILAANQAPDLVSAAIPLFAYQPSRPSTAIPYLFVTGTADGIASPAAILNVFKNSSTGEAKAFARFNGVNHFDIMNGGRAHEIMARYITAWGLRFLAGNGDYGTYLNGDIAKKNALDPSMFASAADYIYEE
jgi:dienelactone hydrolase